MSVGGFSANEYARSCALLDGRPEVEALELNLSCPNVEEAAESAAQIVAACRAVTAKPLWAKLSPANWDIGGSAQAVEAAGADGLSLVNTIRGLALDPRSNRPKLHTATGGLSGPAIKPIALLKVAQVYEVARPHNIPIIGQGGIVNATDALEFLIAGATAVGVGTALFYDPLVCPKINAGIASYLAAQNMTSVTDLTGTLKGTHGGH